VGRPATLKIDILADAKGVGKGVADADSKLSKLGRVGATVGKALVVGLAAGAVAAVAVGRALIQAGERAATSNARVEQVAASMGLFGDKTGDVTKRVLAYGESLARTTGIDTNVIKTTQAKLLTFAEVAKTADVMGGSFDRATVAAVDLAAAGFGSAEANAVQLGKALNDPIKGLGALAKSGVTFTESEKARIKTLVESNKVTEAQGVILSAIEKQVGGVAKATANGSDKMKVAFEQVKERLGLQLLPVFDRAASFVATVFLPAAERLASQLIGKLGPAFTTVAGFVTSTVLPAFRSLSGESDGKTQPTLGKLAAFITGTVVPTAQRLAAFFTGQLVPAFAQVATFVGGNVVPILTRLAGFIGGTLVPAVLNLAGSALGGLRSALTTAQAAIDRNRAELETLGRAVGTVASAVKPLASVVGTVLAAAFRVVGAVIGGIVDTLGQVVRAAEKAVGAIRAVANAASTVGSVLGKLNPFSSGPQLHGMGVPLVGGGGPLATPGQLATAALADTAGLARLSRATPGGAVTVVDRRTIDASVTVNGALDAPAVARQLERLLREQAVRLGRTTAYGAA
jgi:phage-related protein